MVRLFSRNRGEGGRPQEAEDNGSQQVLRVFATVREKLEKQRLAAEARFHGPNDPKSYELVGRILEGAHDAGRRRGDTTSRAFLESVVRGGPDIYAICARDENAFVRQYHDVTAAMRAGELDRVADILDGMRRSVNIGSPTNPDAMVYVTNYVETVHKEAPGNFETADGRRLMGVVARIRSNPLFGRNLDSAGFMESDLRLLDECVEAYVARYMRDFEATFTPQRRADVSGPIVDIEKAGVDGFDRFVERLPAVDLTAAGARTPLGVQAQRPFDLERELSRMNELRPLGRGVLAPVTKAERRRADAQMHEHTKAESAALTWDWVDILSRAGKLELALRLRRLKEAHISKEARRIGMSDAVSKALLLEIERLVLPRIESGSEQFLTWISGMDEGPWKKLIISDRLTQRACDVTRRLPSEEERKSFLRSLFRLVRHVSGDDPKSADDNVGRDFMDRVEQNLANAEKAEKKGEAMAEIRRMLEVQEPASIASNLIDEFDSLAPQGKTALMQGLIRRLNEVVARTGVREQYPSEVTTLKAVCELGDPVRRLPSVAEEVIAREAIETFTGGWPGIEFLAAEMTTAVNHHSTSDEVERMLPHKPGFPEKLSTFRRLVTTSAAEVESQDADRELRGYKRGLTEGSVEGLTGQRLDKQQTILHFCERLATEIRYYKVMSDVTAEILERDPEAAGLFWRHLSLKMSELALDGKVKKQDKTESIRALVSDARFRDLFIQRIETIKRFSELAGMKIDSVEIADALSSVMIFDLMNLDMATAPGIVDKIKANRGRPGIVRPFLESLSEESHNIARAYYTLFDIQDQTTVGRVTHLLKDGELTELDLEGADLSQQRILATLEGIAEKKAAFRRRLEGSGFTPRGLTTYRRLCNLMPALGTGSMLGGFLQHTEGMPQDKREFVLALADSVGRLPAAAACVMKSTALTAKLRELSDAPRSAELFMAALNGRIGDVSATNFDTILAEVAGNPTLAQTAEIERVVDFAAIPPANRGAVVERIFATPPEKWPLLFALKGANGRPSAHRIMAEGAELLAFAEKNPHFYRPPASLRVEVDGDVVSVVTPKEGEG